MAVFGTDTANTVAATKVAVGGPGGPGGHGDTWTRWTTAASAAPRRPRSAPSPRSGTNTFTLTSPDGTKVTVDVGSSTTYREFGKTSARSPT